MTLIAGLPREIRHVPEIPADWKQWLELALLYRVSVRDLIERDMDARADVIKLAAADPLYHQVVFGSHFEPRDRAHRARGWYPSIPFYFQALTTRWFQGVLTINPGTEGALLGRGDAVLEKARDMVGSWTFTNYAGWQWLHEDNVAIGLMSYKEDAVEKTNDTGTLFYKMEGYLGLDTRVPESVTMTVQGLELRIPVRSPAWLVPAGYEPKVHNHDLVLSHPYRTNVITGFATTERMGTGTRFLWVLMDEAAKFRAFIDAWFNVKAVTDHTIALSTPDTRFGTGFRDLARQADVANQKGEKGPSFMRLPAELHPYRDEIWKEEMEARHQGGKAAKEALEREFGMSYEAGMGTKIYPAALTIVPKLLRFTPANEQLDFCIDPGTRSKCAFHLVKYDPGTNRYGVMLSYANQGQTAEFYASLFVGVPVSHYEYGEEEEEVMDFFRAHFGNIRYWVGDPAGKARTGSYRDGELKSFYDDIRDETFKLTDQRRSVRIWSSDKHQFKRLAGRVDAMRTLLQRLDFNNTAQVIRTLDAVREHRWPRERDDRETVQEGEEPVRHPGHDRVTALEYYAAFRAMGIGEMVAEQNNGPVRVSRSGKPLPASAHKKRGYLR